MLTPKYQLNQIVTANKPQCPCKGGGTIVISGSIQKIINNQAGIWYYLSNGSTINQEWIISTN